MTHFGLMLGWLRYFKLSPKKLLIIVGPFFQEPKKDGNFCSTIFPQLSLKQAKQRTRNYQSGGQFPPVFTFTALHGSTLSARFASVTAASALLQENEGGKSFSSRRFFLNSGASFSSGDPRPAQEK